MIKGGTGGAKTNKNGLKFERDTSLEDALTAANFVVAADIVYRAEKEVGELLGKTKLYRFMAANGVDWKQRLSTRLMPDDALFAKQSRTLTIVEKKWQEVQGSVDEKLQTCGFKLRQYRNLTSGLGINVKYVYLLNDWFEHPKYDDVRAYIKETGADYHFGSLPLELFDFD